MYRLQFQHDFYFDTVTLSVVNSLTSVNLHGDGCQRNRPAGTCMGEPVEGDCKEMTRESLFSPSYPQPLRVPRSHPHYFLCSGISVRFQSLFS